MTALFAYVSAQHDGSFVGADDLDLNNQTKVDKVVLCWNRFAIGVYGPASIKTAVSLAAHFDQQATLVLADATVVAPITTADDLCAHIAMCLPRVVAQEQLEWDALKRGGKPVEQAYQAWLKQGGGLAILDHLAAELYEAKLSHALSSAATSPPTFTVTKLGKELGWRFGVNGTQDLGPIDSADAADPHTWATNQLADAISECAQNGLHKVLGGLGASFTKQAGTSAYRSVHSTIDEVLTAYGYP